MSAEYACHLETFSDVWHIDSGATEHMSNRREWFSSYKKFDTVENIKIGDGKYIQAIGSGDLCFSCFIIFLLSMGAKVSQ
uniref:Gag-Pol n=1 Tax=Apis cerana TaxID=7461 RepID=V9ICD9_APICE